ncbi:MAG TPA: hypothetical protein VF058_11615 [Actinomycetota bacterium]
MYRWWVFLHVVGGFGFFMAHGASAMASIRLRTERSPERVKALLDLSSSSLGFMYVSLLLLLAGGIVSGFLGDWWGEGWIWTAIALLILIMGAMYGLASGYYNQVREAAGIQTYEQRKKGIEAGPPDPGRLDVLLSSSRPMVIMVVGFGGLLLILWLMILKPF